MQKLLLIGLAGLVGTLARYGVTVWAAGRFGESFPTGTLVVNLLGCFLAGLLFYVLTTRYPAGETMRAVLLVGLLGGLTTFSSYGLQTFTLLRDGETVLALLNLVASNVGGLLMVWLGYTLARAF